MDWYPRLYVDEKTGKETEKLVKRIEEETYDKKIYLVTLAANPVNLLEIIPVTDLKIPLPERDHIPLLCDGREVLWVIGYGVSERMRITENDECVMLNYCRDEQ